MPQLTIVFNSAYSLGASFGPHSDDAELKLTVLSVAAARLRGMADRYPERIAKPEGQAQIIITYEGKEEGPVKLEFQGLGCPRDQMLLVAEWLTMKCQFVWFQVEAQALQKQAMLAKGLGGGLTPPPGIDFKHLRGN